MKYPLTPETKKFAIELVNAWNTNEIDQLWSFVESTSDDMVLGVILFGIHDDSSLNVQIFRHNLSELALYGLVHMTPQSDDGWEILLLQELRNAVATDFEVSDYFLTMNAVGNIIINSQTGNVQGVGYSAGDVTQTIEQLADELIEKLGDSFLRSQEGLHETILQLKVASVAEKRTLLGRIIQQLGKSLEHGAYAGAIITALPIVQTALQRL
jgi:hypothetical protein